MLMRTDNWPPDYDAVMLKRLRILGKIRSTNAALADVLRKGAIEEYKQNPIDFIETWCDTFDPRNAGSAKPTRMPFILFPRQREFIEFLHECSTNQVGGLIEKSRDMGATWLCCAYSVWSFLFVEGSNIGWGSRKAASVDRIGDMNSIFEKIRYLLNCIPREFVPSDFGSDNMSFMRVHASNGNSITGESGDDIGRGGRTSIYFKDESAHYEHPEAIEAALGDTTRVQIDISSVNGVGNVFHRKREAGTEWTGGELSKDRTNVFVFDWREHPGKDHAWYEARKAKAEADGLLHLFKQEVDRDYASSVVGVIIPPEWIAAAIDAHTKLELDTGRGWHAGLDVADEGGDRNALVTRRGILVTSAEEWGARDTGETTRRTIEACERLVVANSHGRRPIKVYYDSIGVGSGVKAEANRLEADGVLPAGIKFYSWNAGAKVLNEDERVEDVLDGEVPTNKEFFQNLKAQAWWSLRRRFERTYRAVKEGIKYPVDDLISIPSTLPHLRTLQKELSQPTSKKSTTMKLMVDKKPEGTKSPNIADALVMCYFPVEGSNYDATLDWL